MNHPYIKPVFVTYILVMSIIAFFGHHRFDVYAEEMPVDRTSKHDEHVYQLEMNLADFEEIKEDILREDIRYIAKPESFENDLELSEIVLKNVDYTSQEEQTVDVVVVRYTNSKDDKQVLDTLESETRIVFVDTTAPEITLLTDKIELEEGDSFDAKDYLISVTDNSFKEIKVDIEDPVDTKKSGSYTVVYTAVDQSGNQSKAELKVLVNELEEEEEEVVVVQESSAQRSYTPPVVSASTGSAVYDTLAIINQYRASAGLHPLQLAGGAEQQAIAIRAAEAASFVSHTRPDGRNYDTAFTDAGLHHSVVLEILTYSGSSPADKVAWWMSSGAHAAILMRSDITHIAIGINSGMYAAIVYR